MAQRRAFYFKYKFIKEHKRRPKLKGVSSRRRQAEVQEQEVLRQQPQEVFSDDKDLADISNSGKLHFNPLSFSSFHYIRLLLTKVYTALYLPDKLFYR